MRETGLEVQRDFGGCSSGESFKGGDLGSSTQRGSTGSCHRGEPKG